MRAPEDFATIDFGQFSWLERSGVPVETLIALMPMKRATGVRASDGRLDLDPDGRDFLVFEEPEDDIFWNPRTGEIATWHGRAFALGEAQITRATTYAFDNHLNIHANPLDWMRARCEGIVVLDWTRAFDRLRDAPRIAISESVLFLYRRWMRPARLPELVVVVPDKKAAAA